MMIRFLDRITYGWAVVVVVFVALSLFGAVAYVIASLFYPP
jgi:phage shock protein PspC (stress-responsive transcriptional regulator)